MVYSSKQNSTIKKIASLKEKKFRQKYGLYISEGIKPVNDAISLNKPIKYIVATQEILDKILPNNLETLIVTNEVFSYITTEVTPQGVLCVIEIGENQLCQPSGNAVLLDGVQDPGNIGTIIRSCLAFGYKDIYLVNCCDAYSPKVVRSSMSAIYSVNIYKGSLEEVLSTLKGYKIIVADMVGESLHGFKIEDKYVLCMGSEGNGISNELYSKKDRVVSIPMNELSESLNVSVATSIIMYELSK